jgi:geranylgeranyl diphosphate synthase type II
VTCDLRTGKQTPLIVHARSTAQWGRISTFLGRDLRAEELDEVRALLEESGSRDFVEDLADRYLEEARSVLRTAGLPVEILDRVTTRPLAVGDGEAAA